MNQQQIPLVVGSLLAILVIGGGSYYTYDIFTTLTHTRQELTATKEVLDLREQELTQAAQNNRELSDALAAERTRNDAFAAEIGKLSGTVGKLDKLSRTDPELLQKYSKVYFLNENYAPETIDKIPLAFVHGEDDEYISGQVWPFLKDLLEAAADEDIDLRVISGFRSFGTQAALKASYKITYGAGANAFSADQGYSEHQLGAAVDFTTPTIGSSFTGFDASNAFAWLEENAYRYGFILSYPAGNTFYQYEPWHWRFVGKELATDLHKDQKHFYDLDQRTLDTYLINIFD